MYEIVRYYIINVCDVCFSHYILHYSKSCPFPIHNLLFAPLLEYYEEKSSLFIFLSLMAQSNISILKYIEARNSVLESTINMCHMLLGKPHLEDQYLHTNRFFYKSLQGSSSLPAIHMFEFLLYHSF